MICNSISVMCISNLWKISSRQKQSIGLVPRTIKLCVCDKFTFSILRISNDNKQFCLMRFNLTKKIILIVFIDTYYNSCVWYISRNCSIFFEVTSVFDAVKQSSIKLYQMSLFLFEIFCASTSLKSVLFEGNCVL